MFLFIEVLQLKNETELTDWERYHFETPVH